MTSPFEKFWTMDEETKKLLRDNCVSDYMIELLVVYDYIRIKDISQIDADCLKEIEENVRQKNFSGRFDPDSKAAREKFFGCEDINFTQYSIPFNARRKLLSAAAAATSALNESNIRTEIGCSDVKCHRKVPETTSLKLDELNSDQNEPREKKAGTSLSEAKLKIEKENNFRLQAVKVMNDFIAKKNCSERADCENIEVSFDVDTGRFKAKCRCVYCWSWFACYVKGKSVSTNSFNRHLTNSHLNTKSKLDSKLKRQKAISNPIHSFFIKSEIKDEPDDTELSNDQKDEIDSIGLTFVTRNLEKNAATELVLLPCPQELVSDLPKVSKTKPTKKKKSKNCREVGMKNVIEVGGIKYHQCSVCETRLKSSTNLKKHMATHSAERNFVCDICGATFKTKTNVWIHKLKHKEKHLSCDLCPKQFRLKYDLREHVELKHLGGSNLICPNCGKTFGNARLLTKHIYFQHREKKSVCEICGFKAINKQKIERHMKSHTGERNFGCEICGKRFLYSYNVQAHINYVHNRHKRPSLPEDKLICTVCGQKFRRICKTKQHMALVHNVGIDTL